MPQANPVLVEVTRGNVVESLHRGRAAVVDTNGRIVAAWGDVHTPTYVRSTVKPMQAIPLIESGAADQFGLSDAELALACASHGGTKDHVDRIRGWLSRLGLGEDALACGPHPPIDIDAQIAVARGDQIPTRLHNNCSGKHAGYLTVALHCGVPTTGYECPEHPVQQQVTKVLGEMTGVDMTCMPSARDGCGVPVFALPLAALALGMARFADPSGLSEERRTAVRRLFAAVTANPILVAGVGRFDTEVMVASAGRALVKSGAEAVQVAALAGRGLGIAVKIDDGAKRAAEAAMAALLLSFGEADKKARARLTDFARRPIHDTTGIVVGHCEAAQRSFDTLPATYPV